MDRIPRNEPARTEADSRQGDKHVQAKVGGNSLTSPVSPGGPGGGTADHPPVQAKANGSTADDSAALHDTAAQGVTGGGGALPHMDRIQEAFGRHDISSVRAHTGSAATAATSAMGAEAYATGNDVAFASGAPSLHTAAHEAAHVVQQRGGVQLKGGIGEANDAYEQHADAVADRVVAGRGAADLLDQMAPAGAGTGGVQKKVLQLDIKSDLRDAMRGWGSGEDRIFARIQRASVDELHAVVADRTLMNELTSDL